MRKRIIGTCIVAAVGAIALSGIVLAEEKPIVIGFAIAQSGWFAINDEGGIKAADLAIDELNAAGGILGRKIKPIYADTKSDRAQGAKAALEVLEKGADVVFVDLDYDMGAPAALEASKAGKISFSIGAEDAKMGVQGVGPLAFTSGPAAQLEGAAMAEWGYEKKGFKTAYILTDTLIEYNKSVCYGYEFAAKTLAGAKIVGRDTFKNGDPSIVSQVTRIKNLDPAPDVITLCTFTPGGGAAVRQIRAAGIKTPIFASIAMDGNHWLDAVPNLNEFYYPVHGSIYGDDQRAAVNDLVKKYKAKYNAEPPFSHAFLGYVAINLYAKAVERAKSTDTKKVVAALESPDGIPTIFGPYSFSNDLHIQNKFSFPIMSIQDGKHAVIDRWTTKTPFATKELLRKAE
jgi:branched-chain amino acid transport system substrate-binding protein